MLKRKGTNPPDFRVLLRAGLIYWMRIIGIVSWGIFVRVAVDVYNFVCLRSLLLT